MRKQSNEQVISFLQRAAVERGGLLTPEEVVALARPKSSIIHKNFCWDDTEAAREYRIIQARELLRVTVRYINVNGDTRPVRVFVSLSTDREKKGGGYRDMVRVLADDDTRRLLLEDALKELAAFEQKYAHLKELTRIFEASRAVREKLQKAWAA